MGEIVAKAEGVFLWVIFVVRTLLEDVHSGDKVVDLRSRLLIKNPTLVITGHKRLSQLTRPMPKLSTVAPFSP